MQQDFIPPYIMHQFWSTDPWIVYQSSERLTVPELLPPVPCIRIIRHARGVTTPEIVRLIRECQEFRPRDVVLYAAQCDAHFELLRRMQLPCVRWNHNALVDERIFKPADVTPWCHTSISRVVPFKRLELATRVPDLKIVGSVENKDYHAWLKPQMPRAEFLNENGRWLIDKEVAALLQQSLAMVLTSDDQIEGNCRAVTEAMLTGCPVVYTAPQRMCETWLVPETSRAAAPAVESVTKAVLHAPVWDKAFIRQRTLQNVGRYRDDLAATVAAAARQLGYDGFILDVQALVDAKYILWQDRERWLADLPPIIRQQIDQRKA